MASSTLNILFIINPASGGKKSKNWEPIIRDYFKQLSYHIEFYVLSGNEFASGIIYWIEKIKPDRIVAVGGDGTVSLVAKQLLGLSIPLAILPGGSANGMAAELNIPKDSAALDIITDGIEKKCDVLKINENNICIHLSDLGLNARIVKYFDKSAMRGMWGYARMLVKILIEGKPVNSHIVADNLDIHIPAFMIVIANATKYGTGAVINPHGSINDGKFELVVVRKISLIGFVKMFLSKKPFNPKNVEIFQTTKAVITTKRRTHFQVDGEFIGKRKNVTAEIIPSALTFLVGKQK
jgi:diacylglycerol kinase family enzyme